MNKTTKALKLAEEAFEALVHTPIAGHIWTGKCNSALFAIREALAEQAEQEQDPVAIISPNKANIVGINAPHTNIGTNWWLPLYTRPVRTKDLTSDELSDLVFDYEPCENPFKFARAVIAADREKNK